MPAPHEASITVVMNGADLRRFSPAPTRNAPSEFGSHMIFACRQLFPRKGIRFLIEAVAKLKPKYPDINLVIAGDGFERPVLEEARPRTSASAIRPNFSAGSPIRNCRDSFAAAPSRSFPRSRKGSASRPLKRWAAK